MQHMHLDWLLDTILDLGELNKYLINRLKEGGIFKQFLHH